MSSQIIQFQETVWNYYAQHKRVMPWRWIDNPYYILISEIMLQQTQVERVKIKYQEFITAFPTVESLAADTPSEVLNHWVGLGYNRRGLFLKRAAEMIVKEYGGIVPNNVEQVDALPGVGYATACAVVTYSYNLPTVFIETNIRTVFIHHFFSDRDDVSDAEIVPLVEQSLDRENPRDWYYALMDYGVMLKKTIGNVSRKSKHYTKQSTFEGSDRQLRGEVLRLMLREKSVKADQLYLLDKDKERVDRVVNGMVKDRILELSENTFIVVEE